jgi:hypothetical protein
MSLCIKPAEANQVPEIFVDKACRGKDYLAVMTSEKLSWEHQILERLIAVQEFSGRRVFQFFPFKPD